MRKFVLVVCLLASVIGVQAQFSGKGAGSSSDPYQITDAYELSEVRNDLTACYKLMNDIDLAEWIQDNNPSLGWSPIGTSDNNFTGTFDGNYKCIYGLMINRPSTDCVGLFSTVSGGTIKNVTLINPNIKGASYVGGLCGYTTEYSASSSSISISNCSIIAGTITGINYVGGLCGYTTAYSTGSISNCSIIAGTITGSSYVGGLCGASNGRYYYSYQCIRIISCYITADVKGNSNVGGIVGYSASTINDNIFGGNVGGASPVGGIVGMDINQYTSVVNCYATGTVKGNGSSIGGINGLSNGTVKGNVCLADEIHNNSNTPPYRISESSSSATFSNNIAWIDTKLIQNGKVITVEDNLKNGIAYGQKTLMRASTYVGLGWDFTNTWTITEGESYPYLKAQTVYPVVTSCEASSKCIIRGTATASGKITVVLGKQVYSSHILDNAWEVSIGAASVGDTIRVFAQAEGKMPSLVKTTVITSGGGGTNPDVVAGDANGDGSIDTSDVVAIVNHILGKSSVTFVKGNADINGDGTIYVDDAVATVQLVLDKQ